MKIFGVADNRIQLVETAEKLDTIIQTALRNPDSTPATLIFPGTQNALLALAPYMRTSNGYTLNLQRVITEKKWSYFGSCGGAILGSSRLFIRDRQGIYSSTPFAALNLLGVDAYGHIFPEEICRKGTQDLNIQVTSNTSSRVISMPWNNGPRFNICDPNVQSIASYTEGLPPEDSCAGVMGKLGGGSVVLLATHPEFKLSDPYQDQHRYDFLREIFERLGTIPPLSILAE